MDLEEQWKSDYHQTQMNKLYDNIIKGYLSEIKYGKTNSAIANRVLSKVRAGLDNDEVARSLIEENEYIDFSPWLTNGVPYKLYIVADYYRWREHFKSNGTLVNTVTGKKQ